jgi:hypothetical protein|tara:strand:+ start:254 stop:622 length:369 start_codon:yes stop_codon:yes gene_type:complete
MAYSASSEVTQLVASLYVDTNVNSTAQTDITGAAATLYGGEIDNRLNQDQPVFVKFYNSGSVTNASNPLVLVYVPPASIGRFVFPEGIIFDTAVSALVTTTAATNNSPQNANNQVTARLLVV